MSGQREQWDGPEQPDQPDSLDSTLIMARLFGRFDPDHANGHGTGTGPGNGNGNGGRASAGPGTGTGVAPAPLSYLTPDATAGRHRTTRTVHDVPGDPGRTLVTPAAELAPKPAGPPVGPDQAGPPEASAAPAAPDQRVEVEQAAAPGKAIESEPAARPDKAAAPEPVARPEQAAAPVPAERPETAFGPEPVARPEQAAAPVPAERPAQAEHAAQPEHDTRAAQPEEAAYAAQPEGAERADGPGATASSDPTRSRIVADQPASRPEPGTWADFRQRLERLPYGHPSSPYHVDGERKPPPPRLIHLELAPPARETSPRPSPIERPEADRSEIVRHELADDGPEAIAPELADVGQSEASPPDLAASNQEDQAESQAAPIAGRPATSDPDEGQHPVRPVASGAAAEPDAPVTPRPERGPEPDRHEHPVRPVPAADQTRHEHAVRTVPAPESSQDRPEPLLAAVANGSDRPAPAAPAKTASGHETTAGGGGSGSEHSLPAGRRPARGPGPAGPHLTADGSWTWGPASLTPDQVRVAEDAYDRFRAAEGRSLFGSYSSSGLTTMLRRIEDRLGHGQLAPDTEQHALLSVDLFRARFADLLRRHPDRRPELLARRIPGAISYSFIFEAEHYADGIRLVQEALEVQGFQLQARKNSWSSLVNRCVFTMWRDPLNDLPFEVQFHTPASVEARQLARTSAALIRDPRIPPAEAASLQTDLASAWAALPSPPGNAEIGDYRRDGSRAPGR